MNDNVFNAVIECLDKLRKINDANPSDDLINLIDTISASTIECIADECVCDGECECEEIGEDIEVLYTLTQEMNLQLIQQEQTIDNLAEIICLQNTRIARLEEKIKKMQDIPVSPYPYPNSPYIWYWNGEDKMFTLQ